MKKTLLVPILLALVCLLFFWQFFFKGLLPIPSDTIIGLYHPFRDLYEKQYPNGVPYKNFLITDPVRQQYPWRNLAINIEKQGQIPLWNPYSFSGTPLLANLQSAVFYPLNIFFFLLPFPVAWAFLILLEPLLASLFMYWYLRNLKLHFVSSFLGGLVFAFCGFSVAWMEWGTIGHTLLWLPLLLLCVDKILASRKENVKFKIQNSKLPWIFLFVFSLSSSFFAGHLQTFFYLALVVFGYLVIELITSRRRRIAIFIFLFCFLVATLITTVQWQPALAFIKLSARDIDLNWQTAGWFIPFQHLVQFIAPDFFGNPTTLNYWGTWNYGELTGYIGIIPLIAAFTAVLFARNKKTYFFFCIIVISFLFALPTPLAKLPFVYHIPFLSTAQPARLLAGIDFSLAVLAGFGFDYLLKKRRNFFVPVGMTAVLFGVIWAGVLFGKSTFGITPEQLAITKHNLVFPTIIFLITFLVFLSAFIKQIKRFTILLSLSLILIVIIDLFRFGSKFLPFTDKKYLFPSTQTISYLQNQKGIFRIMTTDDKILPPNFSVVYHLQSISGYDPLYLRRYGELMAANERKKADIHEPFGFNRIITPKNADTTIIDLLGVKYVLSLSEQKPSKLKKVFQEGKTHVYENIQALPRTFFVKNILFRTNKQEIINLLFDPSFFPQDNAIIETQPLSKINKTVTKGSVEISDYQPNSVTLLTENSGDGFLVLTDPFYSSWQATVDSLPVTIYETDYAFRGIFVPKGQHRVQFYTTLF